MTVIQKTIGRLPVNLGDYDSTRAYGKKNRVLLYGCEWESKVNNNTYAPAALNTTTGVIAPDTTHWKLISGSYNTWLIDNGYQKLDASNVKDGNHTQHETNEAIAGEIGDDESANTIKGRITNLENEVGTGGSVDERIAAEGDRHYLKSETYTKSEVNGMITTPDQEYKTVTATDQTTAVTDVLPATGEPDTVYRVGNWDGNQYDATAYSEYAWNESTSQYIHLSTKTQIGEVFDISAYHATGGTLATYSDLNDALNGVNGGVPQSLQKGGMSVKFVQSSDNKYVQCRLMADEFTTDTTQWAIADEGVYVENSEFVEAHTDANDKVLYGVKYNGDFYFGAGAPSQVREEIDNKLEKVKFPFKGKNLFCIGDSITALGYPDKLNVLLQTHLTNKGLSGSEFASTGNGTSIAERVDEIEGDYDIIIIYGGVNDFGRENTEFGDVKNLNGSITTFCGAVHHTYSVLKQNFPNAKIIAVNNYRTYCPDIFTTFSEIIKNSDGSITYRKNAIGKTLQNYRNAINTIASMYGIPVIDMQGCGFSFWDDDDRIRYSFYQNGAYDGLHPSDEGEKLMAKYMASQILSYVDVRVPYVDIDEDYAESLSTIDSPEFIEATTDSEDKVLEGITSEGVKQINLPIDTPSATTEHVENSEWLSVTTDLEGKLLEGITSEGVKQINLPIDTPSATTEHVENSEWLSVTTDLEGKLLEGINNNGEKVFGKIPPQIKELIGCGKLIIAASNSKYKQFANVICTGEHDQDVINEYINNPDVKSIYFLDGTYLIDAPILPKSGLYIEAHNDSLFTTIDIVEATLTEEVSSGNTLKLSSVTGFHPGMLLYVANDSGDFDSIKSWGIPPKIISINTSNNTITVSSNVPRTFPIGTSVKSASPCFLIDHISNVTINCVNIDWNVANNPRQKYNPWYLQEGIQIAYSEYVTVKNCKINNGGRRGICTTNSKYYQILNNYFNNWHEHSIDIFWENYVPYDGYENLNPPMAFGVISGNVCLNNQMSGIQCHRGSGCTITGNTIKNCSHGGISHQEYAHHNAIVGNIIEGCGAGLRLGGHDVTASGNVIKDCDFGVQIGDFSERVIVDGNNIQNSQNSAINFYSARFCRVSNNIITNSCLAITDSSSSDIDVSVVSITERHGTVYDGESHHNQVIGNTFIEESRELLPKYIFKNPEDNTKNVVVRNLCIIDGTIETPFDYTTSDVVKDNDIIN